MTAPLSTPTHTAACSCGEHKSHVIAERLTADGIRVCLWDDGALTGAMGYKLRGSARGRYVLFEERMSSAPGVRSGLALYQTGFAFRTLADLWAHLDQVGVRS